MTTIKLRRGTAAQWAAANPILAEGEPGFETDTGKHKIGDGVTAWAGLSYFIDEAALSATFESLFRRTLAVTPGTDITAALQTAVNDAFAGTASPRIHIPRGSYYLDGPLQVPGTANAQIVFPFVDNGNPMVTITIEGDDPPAAFPTSIQIDGVNWPAPIGGTVLYSRGAASGTNPSIFASDTGASGTPMSNSMVKFRNITIRQASDPTLHGLNLEMVGACELQDVRVDVDAASPYGYAQPTHATTGIILPDDGNYAVVRGRGVVQAYGYDTGLRFHELANIDEFMAEFCNFAMKVGHGNHSSRFGRVTATNCVNTIGVYGATAPYSYFVCDVLNVEDASSGWYSTNVHVNDPSNLIHCETNFHRVQSGVGPVHGLKVSGGQFVRTRMVGGSRYGYLTRNSGNIAFGSIVNAPVDSNLDLSLDAQPGDIVDVALNALVAQAGNGLYFNLATVVGGVATVRTNDPGGWVASYGTGLTYASVSGSLQYQLTLADIDTDGVVRLRLMAHTDAATPTRQIYASSPMPLQFSARVLDY